MARKRTAAEIHKQPVGGRVSPKVYAEVVRACKDTRTKPSIWKIGDFSEAAFRMLLAFSPIFQRTFVERIHDEAFWLDIREGVREIEPMLLRFLSRAQD